MRRILFHWRGTAVYSYPVMLYLGIVLGIYAELFAAGTVGLDRARVLAATLILLTSALLGARLLFVAANWKLFRTHPERILRFSDGGASMYGGLLLAVPLSIPLLNALGISAGLFWDCAALTMLIGMIVTRVGCLLNGCCAGKPTCGPLGVNLTDYRGVTIRRLPTQLFEAAWGLAVLFGAWLLWGRLPFAGGMLLYILGGYGAGRALLESTREEQDQLFGVTLHRAISTALLAIAVLAFTLARRG